MRVAAQANHTDAKRACREVFSAPPATPPAQCGNSADQEASGKQRSRAKHAGQSEEVPGVGSAAEVVDPCALADDVAGNTDDGSDGEPQNRGRLAGGGWQRNEGGKDAQRAKQLGTRNSRG